MKVNFLIYAKISHIISLSTRFFWFTLKNIIFTKHIIIDVCRPVSAAPLFTRSRPTWELMIRTRRFPSLTEHSSEWKSRSLVARNPEFIMASDYSSVFTLAILCHYEGTGRNTGGGEQVPPTKRAFPCGRRRMDTCQKLVSATFFLILKVWFSFYQRYTYENRYSLILATTKIAFF